MDDSFHRFIRDPNNPGALINTDNEALAAYKKRRKVIREKDAQIKTMEERLNNIEKMLQDLMSNR